MSTPIEDYAFLSDMETGALVSRSGSIDWLCWPRFDSPASFCSLLHDESAGFWSIAPAGSSSSTRRYLTNTLIVETTFETEQGSVALTDFLALSEKADPRDERGSFPENVLVRSVRGLTGSVTMESLCRPRLDYGALVPWIRKKHGVVEAIGGPDALDLVSSARLDVAGGDVRTRFEVSAGSSEVFLLSYHSSHKPARELEPGDAPLLLEHTSGFWKRWVEQMHYEGPLEDQVARSLLTLKGLTYAPSGGLVAAATTSLPEDIGGGRNWDYRYCWLRDATFTLEALLDYGFTGAAREWRDWLLRAVAGDPEDMQIMYGVLGERRLPEYTLDLKGYEGSRPVRVGNAAHSQFQLDVYGELMDSFHSARRAGIQTRRHAWSLERDIVDHVCRRWRDPDEGIWEVRSGPRHFVHSKVMAWVALDRGIKAIEVFGEEGPIDRWKETREDIHRDVYARGVDPERGCFVRSYGETELDASLLMLPIVGFVDIAERVMVNTIDAIAEDLVIDGFVHRYRTDRADDGLPPGEGTFLMCTFWLVDCLALLGRTHEARELFEKLLSVVNDVGLLAEQYDAGRGRQVGNFPQAFSHVALLTSIRALASAGETPSMRRGQA